MQSTRTAPSLSSILAVVVLYNCALSESQSVSSLFAILGEDLELAKHFSLVLYDNSPEPQDGAVSASFATHYVHDPSNGGLASAYNFALARAEAEGREWLLLFDQDTVPTREFLLELAETTAAQSAQARVGAIVPKLLVDEKIYSPEDNFLYQVRHPLQRFRPVGEDVVGMQEGHLNAYNSGSTLRVSALRSIGGFPAEFWLDYLDHAVFHALFVHGYRVFVMKTQMTHNSSLANVKSVPIWRLRNILQAQTLFVKQSGNFFDRLLYRLFLLRFSRGLWKHRKDSKVWMEAAQQALLLRARGTPRPGRISH
jgi:GT2 family glycosyltransferase